MNDYAVVCMEIKTLIRDIYNNLNDKKYEEAKKQAKLLEGNAVLLKAMVDILKQCKYNLYREGTMSHQYYYEGSSQQQYEWTVREQEYWEEKLKALELELEQLQWEEQAIKNDILKVVGFIQQVKKELGK